MLPYSLSTFATLILVQPSFKMQKPYQLFSKNLITLAFFTDSEQMYYTKFVGPQLKMRREIKKSKCTLIYGIEFSYLKVGRFEN